MARDEIEEAYRKWWPEWLAMRDIHDDDPTTGEAFRAGYVAALRRAEEKAKWHAEQWKMFQPIVERPHNVHYTAGAAKACDDIASAIASLLPKEPGDGAGRGG